MTRFGFQLYSLHAIDDPLPTIIDRVGTTTFEGIEFAGVSTDSTEIDAIRTAVGTNSLQTVSAHIGLNERERNLESVLTACRTLDCSDIVVSWLDPSVFESRTSVDAGRTWGPSTADC